MWCHIELNTVLKENYVVDYNMGDKTVCNGIGHIPSTIIMMQ